MKQEFIEWDKKELAREIELGHLPANTTLDEYYYLVNKELDRLRGK